MNDYLEKEYDKNENLKNIIVDHVFLSSLNNNYVGSFLFTYCDNIYNFDLINFYTKYDGKRITDSIIIGNNNLQVINIDDSYLDKFIDDIQIGYIICDPKNELHKKVNTNKNNKVYISNPLYLSDEYVSDINNSINLKSNERLNIYLKTYYTLVDYYYRLLDSSNFNISEIKRFFKYDLEKSNDELREMHCNALMDAMNRNTDKLEDRFLDEEKIKLYTNIINKKSNN